MITEVVYPEVTFSWINEGCKTIDIKKIKPLDWMATDYHLREKLIYISAPYSLGDVVTNVRFACEIGDKVLEKGYIPFIPHLSHFWHYLSPKSWEEWLRIDSAFIPRCDALLRINGESVGADKEVKLAKSLGIPVYYSLEELPLAGF